MNTLLEINQVTVRFGGLVANDRIDLAVAAGSTVGLVGPNGAGKTTLFNVVCGLLDPTEGIVRFDGTDVTTWPPHRRARAGMARTFQRLEVFGHMTVLENLMLPHEVRYSRSGLVGDLLVLPSKRRAELEAVRRAEEIADSVGVTPYLRRIAGELPLGINRLVELGRALGSDPRLVLLDEPSSGLDTTETDAMAAVLRAVREQHDLAVLLVEHDVGFVTSLCEHIYVLDFGRVIASGDPAAVRRDRAVRKAYLGDAG